MQKRLIHVQNVIKKKSIQNVIKKSIQNVIKNYSTVHLNKKNLVFIQQEQQNLLYICQMSDDN